MLWERRNNSRRRFYWGVVLMVAVAVAAAAVVAGVYLLIEAGYAYPWTGFADYTPPKRPDTGYQRAKTTWDWLQLLVVPLAVAVATFALNQTEKRREAIEARERTQLQIQEERIRTEYGVMMTREMSAASTKQADQHSKDAILEAYLDRMSELLTEKQLLKSQPDDEVRQLARIRTLTALRRLDGDRNKVLTQFLQDAGLFHKQTPIIDLSRADLRGADLQGVFLHRAKLQGAKLQGAKLQGAHLFWADLRGANLRGADLHGAFLVGANLDEAEGVNLEGAFLSMDDLQGGNPDEATMPDGSEYEIAAEGTTTPTETAPRD